MPRPVDQILGHGLLEWSSDHVVQVPDLRCEVGNGLAGRVSAADESDFLSGAQAGLDRRCPVGDASPFQLFDIDDIRPTVARSRRDHDGTRPRGKSIAELK